MLAKLCPVLATPRPACRLASACWLRLESSPAELVGDVLIVLVGDELPLALAQTARQRLLVEAREVAAGAGEHAVHLVGDVGVGGGERVGKAGRRTRIQEARLQVWIELAAILLVGAADHRRLRLRVAAGEQRVGEIGRLRQELADIARVAGKPANRSVLLRRERGVGELPLQLREDAREKRLRWRPRIGCSARAGGAGGGAARAVARIDEAVDRLIFVDGLRGSAHAMKLRSSNVVMRGLDPRIHRFREEDGPAGHKPVHARLPTRYARG